MQRTQSGFTFVEVMIVVGLIAILVAVIIPNINNARQTSRDAQRQADLRALQNAVELYHNKYGRYPEACRGPLEWSGETGTDYECPPGAGGQYIVGLAPEFIPALPTDPKPGMGDYGYVYLVNAEGSVYKIMAQNSVEVDTVTAWGQHEFQACDIRIGDAGLFDFAIPSFTTCPYDPSDKPWVTKHAEGIRCAYGRCNMVVRHNFPCDDIVGYYTPMIGLFYNSCNITGGPIENSYAVWGGYAGSIVSNYAVGREDLNTECYTERIICAIPDSDNSFSHDFMPGYNP